MVVAGRADETKLGAKVEVADGLRVGFTLVLKEGLNVGTLVGFMDGVLGFPDGLIVSYKEQVEIVFISVCMFVFVCMYDALTILSMWEYIFITLKDGRVVGMALGEKVGVRVGKVLGFAVAY